MAVEFKHHRYFQKRSDNYDESEHESPPHLTFTSVDNAKTLINFNDTLFDTGNATRTYALADNNQGLKMTMEFASQSDQASFETAASNAWADSTRMYADLVWCYKHEWLNQDGSVSATTNLPLTD